MEGSSRVNVREQATERSEIADKLLRSRTDFVPHGIEDTANDHIERTKVRIVDGQIIQIQLEARMSAIYDK